MVVATTFASNLARLDTLIHAGEKAGRKIVLTGRSLRRILTAARESGYLQDINPLVDEKDIARFARKELLVIATGCQGEPLAATSKMATKSHPTIRLAPKDTVIFSSKIIPGNDKKIFRLFNSFIKMGIEVITERDHFVHVSGHPAVDELKRMYALVRPKICLPVHGEAVHIHEHARLARSCGIEHAIEVENGSVINLNPITPKEIAKVVTGYLAVDGNYLLPSESPIFKMRRRMRESGIVVASVVLDKNGKLIARPIVSLPGLLDEKEDEQLINIMKSDIAEVLDIQHKATKGRASNEQIEGGIRSSIRKILKHEMNKSPIIIVNIEAI
jgi:ribonuclease J